MRRIALRLLTLGFGIAVAVNGSLAIAAPAHGAENLIPDPGLRTCITDNMSRFGVAPQTSDSITATDIQAWTAAVPAGTAFSLACVNLPVASLHGIQNLHGLTKLYIDGVGVLSDISPLSGLPSLIEVWVINNHVTDASPLAALPNLSYVSLARNRISDLSSFSYTKLIATEELPSEYPGANLVDFYYAREQTLPTRTEQVGTVALPVVKAPAGDPAPIVWSVAAGAASINGDGTVTYSAVGPVTLAWADTQPCTSLGSSAQCAVFSGTVPVNVTESDAPEPSVPDSEAEKDEVDGTVTGGAARAADGSDSYELVATVKDEDGVPLTGLSEHLTAQTPAQVLVSAFVDNGDGTYSVNASSATPGNYEVTVLLDGESIGVIPVNFVGASIEKPSVSVNGIQESQGLGFLPGEQVTVTVYSDPIVLGAFTADSVGTVPVEFAANLDVGRHRIEFMGAVSGLVTVAFDVVATADVRAGGTTTQNSSTGWALAMLVLVASGFAAMMSRRQMARR